LVKDALLQTLFSIERFSHIALGCRLRRYQVAPLVAIVDSVIHQRGESFVVMFSRQAGKNQVSAILEAYLLCLYQRAGGSVVKSAPTSDQCQISLDRLMSLAARSPVFGLCRSQHRVMCGQAQVAFLSGHPSASVVGHTASLLLECDEAQDQDIEVWQKRFVPMGASTNATTVYWGTAWSAFDLLGLMRRQVKERNRFIVPWPIVAAEVPAYRSYVENSVMTADHPLFKSQYALEEVDAQAGMFPEQVRFMMRGQHAAHVRPVAGERYYITIDVGGEAHENEDTEATGRDSTAVTVWTRHWENFGSVWRVVHRHLFTGEKPDAVSLRVCEIWRPVQVCVDATGVGAGVASMLIAHRFNVVPFVFSAKSKSDLGWNFIGLCRQGRFQDHVVDGSPEQREFWRQVESAQLEVLPGPGRLCRWSVPRSEGHDDLLVSAALIAELVRLAVAPYCDSVVVTAADVLDDVDRSGF
jgi:hypothetical protein